MYGHVVESLKANILHIREEDIAMLVAFILNSIFAVMISTAYQVEGILEKLDDIMLNARDNKIDIGSKIQECRHANLILQKKQQTASQRILQTLAEPPRTDRTSPASRLQRALQRTRLCGTDRREQQRTPGVYARPVCFQQRPAHQYHHEKADHSLYPVYSDHFPGRSLGHELPDAPVRLGIRVFHRMGFVGTHSLRYLEVYEKEPMVLSLIFKNPTPTASLTSCKNISCTPIPVSVDSIW